MKENEGTDVKREAAAQCNVQQPLVLQSLQGMDDLVKLFLQFFYFFSGEQFTLLIYKATHLVRHLFCFCPESLAFICN